ncbi:FlxA-like family protein [Curvibacter sp. RS43]|uniref:FlxA-like family protein n=1 Tax=Curvibacter microcysteis TaxID=3026419 RepID=UPI00235F49E7|nr:FlxA-like family protein [Curvibacter sp. RS43]MDD0809268.1 FlxA-like family protein [Curvibacter sp. RS43]
MSISPVSSTSSRSGDGVSDDSLRAQIAKLTQQIAKLSVQLQAVVRSDASPKEKQAQAKVLRLQMDLLSQQLAQLIAEQARRQKSSAAAGQALAQIALTQAERRERLATDTYSRQGRLAGAVAQSPFPKLPVGLDTLA